MYNHQKLRTAVFSLSMYEPFISINVACSLQRSQPCCSAMIWCSVVLQSATTPLDATTSYNPVCCVNSHSTQFMHFRNSFVSDEVSKVGPMKTSSVCPLFKIVISSILFCFFYLLCNTKSWSVSGFLKMNQAP